MSGVLLTMERNGVLIDMAQLQRQGHELGQKMMELEREAHELGGGPFNLGSPKQLCEMLFDRLQLKAIKKTPSGAPSIDEEVLEKLALDHPICATLLEHRSISKLKCTYTDKLPRMVHPQHRPRAHQLRAGGRGHRAALVDRSQPAEHPGAHRRGPAHPRGVRRAARIEDRLGRLLADRAAHHGAPVGRQEPARRLHASGEDVHRHTAAEVFDTPLAEVTSEQRRYAKVINFGLIYGMSAFGLAQQPRHRAHAPRRATWTSTSRATRAWRSTWSARAQEARERGYVETVFGRRLWLPDIGSSNQARRQGAERQAINAPMQGTAADLIKMAMIAVQGWIEREGLATKLVMQVHDELVLEVPEARARAREGRRREADDRAWRRSTCRWWWRRAWARTGKRRTDVAATMDLAMGCGRHAAA